MRQIRVGIIGAGAISSYHLEGINGHPQAEVVAVADVSPQRREAFARRYDIPRTYACAEQLIADAELDAVTIALPNVLHVPVATMALEAGKHVLLEKPFARNLTEAMCIAQAAERSGKILMVGMNQRYSLGPQTIKALAKRGDLGSIYHGKTAWMRRAGIPKLGTWFCRKDMAGGGALLDTGVHMLDLCLYLMGNFQAEAVTGAMYSHFGPRGLGEGIWGESDRSGQPFDVEDFATALIRLKGGATVALDVSWAIHQESIDRLQVQVYGTEGGATVFPSARLFQRQGQCFATVEPTGIELACPSCCRFANWIDAILGSARPICTMGEALAVQLIIDATYESIALAKEVRIDADLMTKMLSK